MTTPRRTGGLGRGLGALIPTGPVQPEGTSSESAPAEGRVVEGARYEEVPVEHISPNPLQPRSHFDEEALAELVVSIREVGLLQPIVVREIGPDRFELVMGERRWRAAKEAGLEQIGAIVRETSDDDMLRDALLENLHRQQLNPLEEAAAYQQLLHEFGATHEELAAKIGRSRPQISNTIRLLNLPGPVQRRVAAGVLSAGHARAILGLQDAAAQEEMASRVVAEGLSVRGVEEAVQLANADSAATSDAPAPTRAAKASRPVPAGLAELGERLSDRLETRVKVDLGRSKGKIVIDFASIDDLERIVEVIDARAGTAEPALEQHEAGGEHPEGEHSDGEHHDGEHHDGGHHDGGHHDGEHHSQEWHG